MFEKQKRKKIFKFKFFYQLDEKDCGPTCLRMISNYYGKNVELTFLRQKSYISKLGVSLLGISQAAESIGFDTLSVKLDLTRLKSEKDMFPCILHWKQNHFVILKEIKDNQVFIIADPAYGILKLNETEFKQHWSSNKKEGIALFLNPTKNFYNLKTDKKTIFFSIKHITKYLVPFKKKMLIMFGIILVGSLLTLILPFLTQFLIDKGVVPKNLKIISLILLAQLALYTGSIILEIIRNWIVIYIGTKLSISIVSEFISRVLKLPLSFFDTKMMGDFQQRIQDNERIENFLTSDSLLTLFSIITFFVFFGVLWYYDYRILLLYLGITVLSIVWSSYWFKKRKLLDYFKFQLKSESKDSIYQIIEGVEEIKLNQFEDYKRIEWKKIQNKLFKINIRILKIDQLQLSGFQFLNQIKNILVTFLAATFVVQGKMTLGELLSVSFIIGQMNSPVNQIISFLRSLQDAKLSLERLDEIQNQPEEEQKKLKPLLNDDKLNGIPKGIKLSDVSFQYAGPKSPYVLKNVNLLIPEGKITAIVGASGSGKTTLMKLLLKFYTPTEGTIYYNGLNLEKISPRSLRINCGVVMQEGYIFSDTIKRNIATGDEKIDDKKLIQSTEISNIKDFVDSLPLKDDTRIGASGNGISGGQKQRLLISRAVYKNPHYLFFDEATSSLDAENEKIIHDNLQDFFKGKTVLIIAHRLSTVKKADQIIVLKNGEIVEQGNHTQLVKNKSEYYNLVKNQLELGS